MSFDKNENKEEFDVSQFDWVKLNDDMNKVARVETRSEKFYRKVKENPLVPIGCLLTTACLCVGLYSFKTGQRQMSQYMMRSRVAAQGFTVMALIAGIGFGFHGK